MSSQASTMVKYFDRDAFLEACRNSVRRGYNRQIALTPEEEAQVADKLYPVLLAIPHEHIAGKPADPHVRCIIGLCGHGGSAQLDVDFDVFDSLPEVEVPEA